LVLIDLYFLISQLIQPINCVLVSEDIPSISIVLSERRSNSLKGVLSIESNVVGDFYTHKPTKENPASWSFKTKDIKFNGEAILLKDGNIWNRYQYKIKSYEVNQVIFSGLSSKLSKITNDKKLLKATFGVFKIGNECYGGRIKKV